MTDDYTSGTTGYGYGAGTSTGTTETAKEQASILKDKAADAGGHLLGEAKQEAAAVAGEARRQLDDLWSRTRSEVSGQAGTQQTRLASGLSTVSGQLSQMASAPAEQNLATDLVRGVGDAVGQVGRWLDEHSPEEVLDEVRRFARRRPGTFLLLAAGAGIVAGRLTRGLKDAPSTPSARTTPTTAPAAVTAAAPPPPSYPPTVVDEPLTYGSTVPPAPAATGTTGWEQP
ncbi:hypothetical protein [Cellulomonas sp.]|uniref:hypothetical protein n=1 Tax=Cellulomonas sp. TaxID=40001 RepID=UPI001B005123|nr:hypothetical protein [Cellulomonas sp.]MBO9555169.1 hypothetical protein [Cellulomonas sp.]